MEIDMDLGDINMIEVPIGQTTGCDEYKSDESDAGSPPVPYRNIDTEEFIADEYPPTCDHDQTRKAAMRGLEFYNERNKGAEYEYVSNVTSIPVYLGKCFGIHANFFARRRSENSDSDVQLFYVEVRNWPPCVSECVILEPKPFSPGETPQKPLYDSQIFHLDGVICCCGYNPKFDLGQAVSFSLMIDNYYKSQEAIKALAAAK